MRYGDAKGEFHRAKVSNSLLQFKEHFESGSLLRGESGAKDVINVEGEYDGASEGLTVTATAGQHVKV